MTTDDTGVEESHASARRQLRSLVDAVTDYAIFLLDADGYVQTWNAGAERIKGYDRSEIVGRHFSAFYPEDAVRRGDPAENLREAARTGRVEREGWRLRKDGSRFWARVVITPVYEDGHLEGFAKVTQDLTERRERQRRLRAENSFVESILDAQPDVLYALDERGRFLRWNDRLTAVTGYDDDEVADLVPTDLVVPEDREAIAEGIASVYAGGGRETREARILTKGGDRVPYEFTAAPMTDVDGEVVGLTGVGRDVSDRNRRERALEEQRDHLQRLDRINTVIRSVDRALVGAEDRGTIESAVVDRLADAEQYVFAVVGTFDPDFETFTPRAWSDDGSYVDAVLPAPGDRSLADGPGATAVRTGRVQVVRDVRTDPTFEPWREAAADRGVRSVASVPLVAGDRSFGVLGVYADRPDAFDDRERTVLGELGATIGNAIEGVEGRRLLHADRVLELELSTTDPGAAFVAFSGAADCRVELERYVPLGTDRALYYATVTGVDADRVESFAADEPAVAGVRHLRDVEGGGLYQFEVRGATLTARLADLGGKTREAVAEDGRASVVVHVDPRADVRALVEAVREEFPETDLRSKRERDRPVETTEGFRQSVRADLTDRQATALETAFYGGYFDWPTRGSDATDLADALGIAPQTYHQHLRVAQRKAFAALFEERDG